MKKLDKINFEKLLFYIYPTETLEEEYSRPQRYLINFGNIEEIESKGEEYKNWCLKTVKPSAYYLYLYKSTFHLRKKGDWVVASTRFEIIYDKDFIDPVIGTKVPETMKIRKKDGKIELCSMTDGSVLGYF